MVAARRIVFRRRSRVDQTSVCLSNSVVNSSPPLAAGRRANSRLPQLLDAAARTFAERGYAGASVREIVGPVGMLPGSLYCHFATKEELLVAVYARGVERIGEAVDAAVAKHTDPWTRLDAAAVAHLSSLLDQTNWSQVVIRIRPQDAPLVEARLVALRDAYESRWQRLVAALPLARSASRHDLRLFLLGALNWSQTWYRSDGGSSPARLARRCVALLKSGLAASSAKAAA